MTNNKQQTAVTPELKCTMSYCDENGCQNRKRTLAEPTEMPNNKQQTAVKLYTEEQLLNTADAIKDYLKNYPEKFHESMIEKHLKNLTPIEIPSHHEIWEEAIKEELNQRRYDFMRGADFVRDKIQGNEQQ